MTELEMFAEPKPVKRSGLGLGSIILLAGIVLVVLVVGLQLARQQQIQPQSGPAPDFTLKTLTGEEVTLSELRGKVVVLNFWASWCVECLTEAPILESVWGEYRDKGVVVLGVAYTDTESGSREFIARFNQTYPNGMDIGTRISDRYHITGVPETFIVDQNGNIAQFYFGEINEKDLSAMLDQLLTANAS